MTPDHGQRHARQCLIRWILALPTKQERQDWFALHARLHGKQATDQLKAEVLEAHEARKTSRR